MFGETVRTTFYISTYNFSTFTHRHFTLRHFYIFDILLFDISTFRHHTIGHNRLFDIIQIDIWDFSTFILFDIWKFRHILNVYFTTSNITTFYFSKKYIMPFYMLHFAISTIRHSTIRKNLNSTSYFWAERLFDILLKQHNST